ncbi:hypothetical protein MXD61_18370 [Frankia sp. AgPm24]|uniref:hypothetical protein n=1 Tax=Frankia sp. AgPm24 TaxID=631128 RepID=UPI00200F3122|nr:hypothetical protein [Frankia sp. AgPm24]MCK9923807.1 hypothetical protein [Frankia sp. AgPm24]
MASLHDLTAEIWRDLGPHADETVSVEPAGVVRVRTGPSSEEFSVDADDSATDATWKVADQLQAILIEARHQPVPTCPRHPRGHPLRAVGSDGSPVWICPEDDVTIATIGRLHTT